MKLYDFQSVTDYCRDLKFHFILGSVKVFEHENLKRPFISQSIYNLPHVIG